MQLVSVILVHWIVIYPVDSAIQLFNNRGLVRSVCEKKKSLSWAPSVYKDLSMRHDWPVKNAFVNLPIRLKGKLKRTSGNFLSLLGAQNKDILALLRRCY